MNAVAFHCVAISRAVWNAAMHSRQFAITAKEFGRYFAKTINLTLCYMGFQSRGTRREALGLADAAFLCCVYDVATDWRSFDEGCALQFQTALDSLAKADVAQLALDLYAREWRGQLSEDGVERGVIALRFVMGMIGRNDSADGWKYWGTMFQVVDDVLDYEDDARNGDLNCLNSPRAEGYLQHVLSLSELELRREFPHGRVLWFVCRQAHRKAGRLLAQRRSGEQMRTPLVRQAHE